MQENEPKQIPGSGEYVGAWSHVEIKNAFEGLNTHNTYNAAVQYSNAATLWDQGVETFARSVIASISQAWEGVAAEAAKDAIKRYTDDARKLEPRLTQLSNQINESAGAIVDTRNAIPGYAAHSWTANFWPPRATEEERSRNEAEQGARDAMNNIYVTRFSDFDAKVPVLPVGVNPTQPLDASAPGPGSPGISTSGNPTGASLGAPSSPLDLDDKNAAGKPDQPAENPGDKPAENQGDQSTQQSPAGPQTTPTGYNPMAADPGTPSPTDPAKTAPAGMAPTGTNPGAPHGPGVPGSPENRSGAPGRSVPGVPGTPSGAPAAAAASASRAASGMPGMMAPGMGGARGGKSEDESGHKIPDYLITQENTDELIGEMPRTVPGGVIGGDRNPT
ncbi:WXG100 family type VII secretion target [Nocardia sp. R6R-6]|uniref:WXG100 family type VII secretion target n=1 Tax=Nocardia sp. R6R-6 TaxID=3459303 RepID=UPI00403E08DE